MNMKLVIFADGLETIISEVSNSKYFIKKHISLSIDWRCNGTS